MPLTVFAEKMGFFHRGSAGIGVAPVDVCRTPPAGPVPVPYTNVLFAEDLIKGSKTVFIDGEPTFLEDYSETSKSIGDNGGTLGGSVITGVILGKGYFLVWSSTVFIEGLGVCRHGDMMGQNSASAPYSSADAGAVASSSEVTAPEPAPVAERTTAEAEVLEATGPGDSEEVEPVPCAFEKVSITCEHTGSGDDKRGFGPFEYTFNGTIQDNLPRPQSGPFNPNIQVVAGPTENMADKVTVEISGGPGYTCSHSHPAITITDRSTGEVTRHQGQTSAEIQAMSGTLDLPGFAAMNPAAVLAYFWFPPQVVKRYIIDVSACGVEADGSPGFGQLSRQLDVYPSDSYKFEFEIPNLVNRSYTFERGRGLAAGARWASNEADERVSWETPYNEVDEETGQTAPVTNAVRETIASIKLVRNNQEIVEASAALGTVITTIMNVENAIQSAMNFINDFQPQVGWSFEFEFGFFKGAFALEWGAKEWQDHRVYRFWKLTADLKLFEIRLELSFGIDFRVMGVFLVTAVIFGQVTGELKLSGSYEATPDEPALDLLLAGEAAGQLGVRAALGADWVAAEGRLQLKYEMEARTSIDPEDGFGIDYKLLRKPLQGVLQGSVRFAGSFERRLTIIEEGTPSEGRFPDGAQTETGIQAPARSETHVQRRRRQRRRRRN